MRDNAMFPSGSKEHNTHISQLMASSVASLSCSEASLNIGAHTSSSYPSSHYVSNSLGYNSLNSCHILPTYNLSSEDLVNLGSQVNNVDGNDGGGGGYNPTNDGASVNNLSNLGSVNCHSSHEQLTVMDSFQNVHSSDLYAFTDAYPKGTFDEQFVGACGFQSWPDQSTSLDLTNMLGSNSSLSVDEYDHHWGDSDTIATSTVPNFSNNSEPSLSTTINSHISGIPSSSSSRAAFDNSRNIYLSEGKNEFPVQRPSSSLEQLSTYQAGTSSTSSNFSCQPSVSISPCTTAPPLIGQSVPVVGVNQTNFGTSTISKVQSVTNVSASTSMNFLLDMNSTSQPQLSSGPLISNNYSTAAPLISSNIQHQQPHPHLPHHGESPRPSAPSNATKQCVSSTDLSLQNVEHLSSESFKRQSCRPIVVSDSLYKTSITVLNEPLVAPDGVLKGKFTIKDPVKLGKATKSKQLHNYLHIGEYVVNLPVEGIVLPVYVPRKSISELKATGALSLGKDGLVKANVAAEETSDSESEYSDVASSSSSSNESESKEVSPIGSERPTDNLGGLRYDIINAVWRPTGRSMSAEDIRVSLAKFWGVVRGVRDSWKNAADSLKQAMECKNEDEIKSSKRLLEDQCQFVEVICKAVLDHGHLNVTRLLSENKALMFFFYQVIANRIRESDFDCGVVRLILKVLQGCQTLTGELLDATSLIKVLTRLLKRGNSATKTSVMSILEKSKKHSKSTSATTSIKENETKKQNSKFESEKLTKHSDVKTTVSNSGNTVKSITSSGTGNVPVKIGRKVKRISSGVTNTESIGGNGNGKGRESSGNSSGTSTTFASILELAKKSGGNAKNLSKVTISDAVNETKNGGTGKCDDCTESSHGGGFSFVDTMNSLIESKSPECSSNQKERSSRNVETPEEKARRERKEARKMLRVSWHPDDRLVEKFTYEVQTPVSEYGGDVGVCSTLGDVADEGYFFRLKSTVMDDEVDRNSVNVSMEYVTPREIDFSTVDISERQRNFWPFGGGMRRPNSTETEIQRARDAARPAIRYSSVRDTPESPNEANALDVSINSGEPNVREFGKVPDLVLERVRIILSNSLSQGSNNNGPGLTMLDVSDERSGLESVFAQFSQRNDSIPSVPVSTTSMNLSSVSTPVTISSVSTDSIAKASASQTSTEGGSVETSTGSTGSRFEHILNQLQSSGLLVGLQVQAQAQALVQVPNPTQIQSHVHGQASASVSSTVSSSSSAPSQAQAQVHSQSHSINPVAQNLNLNDVIAAVGHSGISQPVNSAPWQAGRPVQADQVSVILEQLRQTNRRRPRDSGTSSNGGEEESEDDRGNKRGKWRHAKPTQCRFWREGSCRNGKNCPYLHE